MLSETKLGKASVSQVNQVLGITLFIAGEKEAESEVKIFVECLSGPSCFGLVGANSAAGFGIFYSKVCAASNPEPNGLVPTSGTTLCPPVWGSWISCCGGT